MQPTRSAGIKTPTPLARLGSALPAADRDLSRDLIKQLTLPDEVTALAATSDAELLNAIHGSPFRADVVRSVQKLGVSCPGSRLPRHAGLIRTRLLQGLSSSLSTAHVLLLQLTDPVAVRLIATSTGLDVADLSTPERLDTEALRSLCIATTAPRDPSAPLVLMGLHEHEDPFLSELLSESDRALVAQARDSISEEGWLTYRRWAQEYTGLLDLTLPVDHDHDEVHDRDLREDVPAGLAERDAGTVANETPQEPAPAPAAGTPRQASGKRAGTAAPVAASASPNGASTAAPAVTGAHASSAGGPAPAVPQQKHAAASASPATSPATPESAASNTAATQPRAQQDVSAFREAVAQLQADLAEQVATALAALGRLDERISRGSSVSDADLQAVQRVVTQLNQVHAQAAEHVALTGDEDLDTLLALLDRADAGRSVIEALTVVRATADDLAPDVLAELDVLRQLASDLLLRWPPDDEADREFAASLADLHSLIGDASIPGADDGELMERALLLRPALPQLRKLIAAGNRGKLTVAGSSSPDSNPLVASARTGDPAGGADSLGSTSDAANTRSAPAEPAAFEVPAEAASESLYDVPSETTDGSARAGAASPAPAEPERSPAQVPAAAATSTGAAAQDVEATTPEEAPPTLSDASAPAVGADVAGPRVPSAVPAAEAIPAEVKVAAPTGARLAASSAVSNTSASVSTNAGTTAEPAGALADLDDTHVPGIVGSLLAQGRLGLAHHLLDQTGHPESAIVVLIAALAQRLRTPNGPSALELIEYADLVDNDVLGAEHSELLGAAALIKAALVTGNTRLVQLLHDVHPQLPSAWSRLARLTSEAVSSGALTDSQIHETGDPAALSEATRTAAEHAARRQKTPPRLREHRAQVLLAAVRAPSTDLGAALAVAAHDDPAGLAAAQRVATGLNRGDLRGMVAAEDQKLRQNGKALPAERIDEIAEILLADRDAVARWTAATSRANARMAGDTREWGHERLIALHEHLSDHESQLEEELTAYQGLDRLARGQAAACRALLSEISDIVHGQSAPAEVEPSVGRVLHVELLKVDGAVLEPERFTVTLPDVSPQAKVALLLAAAAEMNWEPALRRHLANDDYDAAMRCAQELDRASGDTSPSGRWQSQVRDARPQRLEELKAEVATLRMLLVQARRGEDQSQQDAVDSKLGELELLLQQPDVDMRRVRDDLDALSTEAAQLRQVTAQSLRERLEELAGLDVAKEDLDRLRAQVDAGDFTAVDDEITNRQQNKRLPVYDRPADLLAFYPAVPDALAGGITNSVLGTVRSGGTIGPLDFSEVGSRAGAIADLLADWHGVATSLRPGGGGWNRETSRNALVPVLVGVGLQAPSSALITLEGPGTSGKGWRFVELRDVARNGKAMVPAFGSQAHRRYRLLLAYDLPDVKMLSALRDSDGSDTPLIVCWFGTLTPKQRLDLARDWSDPTMRPTIVLDEAALTYVLHAQTGHSGTLFATLMNVTLPFTTTSPFSDIKRPSVPIEMFYGRDREKRKIESAAGESLLYGGRNMGKSALLRTIKGSAEAGNGERKAVLLELPRDEAFGAAEEIWGEIAEALEREPFPTGKGMSRAKRHAQVEKKIETWLAENPQSQLLLMLDEVDGFFNADAQVNFNETTRLFQLKERNDRLKIVFAGLHSVNHFHGTGNVPFSPAGALAIGPLDPADAYRLLTGPMHAMGYAIAPEEARRIMMHCNYQPYLIQMFAHQLLEQLHAQRPDVRSGPPWDVTPAMVTRIMNDPGMRNKIFRAFTMTLELDKRFQVIVNLVALHAYDGKRTPLSGRELYDDCRQQWPVGFEETSYASFLELLNELEGLGIVGPQDVRSGRSLRSSALLPSLGSRSEIEQYLATVSDLALTENQARGLMRPALDDKGRPGPLTTDQLATIAGRKGNRTCVLVGSPALGIDHVKAALEGRQPALRKIEFASDAGGFRKLLKQGAAGETRMTVASELWKKTHRAETCEESLNNARSEEFMPEERSAHRAAVLIAGPENGEWLDNYLYCDPLRDSEVVPMERFSARSLLLQWRDRPKLEELGSPELADRVLAATGGWPSLVDQLAQRTLKAGAHVALAESEQRLEQPSWPEHFLAATGALGVSEQLERLVRALVEHGDPVDAEDLAVLKMTHGITDLDRAMTLAEWLALTDRDRDGKIRLAPLVARAWTAAQNTA